MTAAAVLLGLNLALSLGNHKALPGRGSVEREEVETTALHVRRLNPELSEREAYRLALLLQTGPVLVAAPDVKSALEVFWIRGEEPWGTR
jgi:hypothetical protein